MDAVMGTKRETVCGGGRMGSAAVAASAVALFLIFGHAAGAPTPTNTNVRTDTTLVLRNGSYGAMRITRNGVPGQAGPLYVAPGSNVQATTTGGGGTVVIITAPPPVVDRVVVQRRGPGVPNYTFTLNQPRPSGLPPAPTVATLTRTTVIDDTVITETHNIPYTPCRPRAPELAFTLEWGPFSYRWWSDDTTYRRGWSVDGGSVRYGAGQAGFWGW